MPPDVCSAIEATCDDHLAGDWDSLRRWAWVYLHVCILLATVLLGYTVARGEVILAALLVLFPLFYLYQRHSYARPNP